MIEDETRRFDIFSCVDDESTAVDSAMHHVPPVVGRTAVEFCTDFYGLQRKNHKCKSHGGAKRGKSQGITKIPRLPSRRGTCRQLLNDELS